MKNLMNLTVAVSIVLGLLSSSSAMAAGRHIVEGTIKDYRVAEYENGTKMLLIRFNDNAKLFGIMPSCANQGSDFNLNLTSGIADQVLSIIMTAHISRLKLRAHSPLDTETVQCLGTKQRLAVLTVSSL